MTVFAVRRNTIIWWVKSLLKKPKNTFDNFIYRGNMLRINYNKSVEY